MKEKEREAKRLKDELERIKKAHTEKISRAGEELSTTREELDTEYREKIEDLQAKLKREKDRSIEKAVEKVRADLRNQLDGVKNELAKGKAEWSREKKRMLMEHETTLDERVKELEFERDTESKAAKDRSEKLWRKKLDDREAALEERLHELDTEMAQIREKHQEDLRRERERTELRVKEGVRADVHNEVADHLASEFAQEMQKTRELHKSELDELKR